MMAPGSNTWTLNIRPQSTLRLSVSPIHITQQCGPLTTYRRVSCLPVSTICRDITACRSDTRGEGLSPGHIAVRILWSAASALPSRGPCDDHRQLETESKGNGYERSPCLQ